MVYTVNLALRYSTISNGFHQDHMHLGLNYEIFNRNSRESPNARIYTKAAEQLLEIQYP